MITQFDRRESLSNKCLTVADTALAQGDPDSFWRLWGNAYRLQMTNIAALRLENPGLLESNSQYAALVDEFLRIGLHVGAREQLISLGFGPQLSSLDNQ
jgi:adenylate cyclase